MKAAKEQLKVPDAPSMLLVLNANSAEREHSKKSKSSYTYHFERIAPVETVSSSYHALVHTSVMMPDAMKTPAKAAVQRSRHTLVVLQIHATRNTVN